MKLVSVQKAEQAHIVSPAGGWSQPLLTSGFHFPYPTETPPTAAELQGLGGVGQEFVEFRKISQL